MKTISDGGGLRRALVFVGIVWGIAATFILSQEVFLLLASFWVDRWTHQERAAGPHTLVLSRDTTESRSCDQGGSASHQPGALAVAWQMGIMVGQDALLRQLVGTNVEALADQMEHASSVARQVLGEPLPRFQPVHSAYAMVEFRRFVETSAASAAVASKVSSRGCHLFKAAAFWGYAMVQRARDPDLGTSFAAEIGHHASKGDLPLVLVQRLTAPPAAGLVAVRVEEGDLASTARVSEYLAAQREK